MSALVNFLLLILIIMVGGVACIGTLWVWKQVWLAAFPACKGKSMWSMFEE